MALRYSAIAVASAAVKCERFSHGLNGASVLPAGIFPGVKAVTISVVLHFPMPVSASGVKFGALKTPSPGMENPISDPARNWDCNTHEPSSQSVNRFITPGFLHHRAAAQIVARRQPLTRASLTTVSRAGHTGGAVRDRRRREEKLPINDAPACGGRSPAGRRPRPAFHARPGPRASPRSGRQAPGSRPDPPRSAARRSRHCAPP